MRTWGFLASLIVAVAGNTFVLRDARAETWRLNAKVSSAAQDIFYLVEELEKILAPSGWVLVRESIDINEKVAGADFGLPVILETPQYAARFVSFQVKSKQDEKKLQGSIYLIIVRTDASGKALVPLNSSSRELPGVTWRAKKLYLSLSVGIMSRDFSLDVRPTDFNLRE